MSLYQHARAIESNFISACEDTLGGMCLGIRKLGGRELTHGRGEPRAVEDRARDGKKLKIPENQRVRGLRAVVNRASGYACQRSHTYIIPDP